MAEYGTDPIPQYSGSDEVNRSIASYFAGRSPEDRYTELVDLYDDISDDARHLLRKYEMRGSKRNARDERYFQRTDARGLDIAIKRYTQPIPLGTELENGAVSGSLVVRQEYERRNYNARFRATDRLAMIALEFFDESGFELRRVDDLIVHAPTSTNEVLLYYGGRDLDAMQHLLQGMRHAK